MPILEDDEVVAVSETNKEKIVGFSAKEQRVIVRYLFHMKERPTEIHKLIESACGESAAPYRLVKDWIFEDSLGQEDLCVQNQNAYSTATNGSVSVKHTGPTDPALVYRIECLVNKDRRITLERAADMAMVSKPSAQHVLCDVLGLKKMNERWVPRLWTPEQRAFRVSVSNELFERYSKGDDFLENIIVGDESLVFYYTPDKLRRVSNGNLQGAGAVGEKYRPSIEQSRIYFMIFYDVHGLLLAEPLPEGMSPNGGEAYANIITNHLAEAFTRKRKGKSISNCILLHDNTAEHSSNVTQKALRDLGMEQLPHPPASPDLEPHEYWMIPFIKSNIRGGNHKDKNALITAINHHIKQAREEEYGKSIRSLASRWDSVSENSGLYVL